MGDQYRPNAGYGYGGERPRGGDHYGDDRSRGRDYYDRGYDNAPHRGYEEPYRPAARDSNGYTFRGAAERDDRYRPEHDFTYRAPGPPAPRFAPASEIYPVPQRSKRQAPVPERRPDGLRPIDAARQRHAQTHRGPAQSQRGAAQSQRGRGGFRGGRAAHKRDILRADRQTTPEQLEGMNLGGQTRFLDIESTSSGSDSEEIVDLTRDADDDGEGPRKRMKRESPAAAAVPKWSNPDPYTVLPPPETLGAPKKDIVQVIRKAKADAVSQSNSKNAVKDNVDFISFNFDDDEADDNASEDHERMDMGDEADPVQSARGSFSHRNDLHAKIPSAQGQVPSFTSINGRSQPPQPYASELAALPPPLPPPELEMVGPTDEEIVDRMLNESRSMKRKRGDGRSKRKGDIVDEWEENDTDPTPWCKVDHSRTAEVALR